MCALVLALASMSTFCYNATGRIPLGTAVTVEVLGPLVDPLYAPDPLEIELSAADDHIVVAEWSRRIPPIMARIPEMRIGRRWVNTLWILPISVALLLIGIAVARQLRSYSVVQHFIDTYPGQGRFQPPVTTGFPVWLRILHFPNLLFMLFIIRAGIQILTDHPRLQFDAGATAARYL